MWLFLLAKDLDWIAFSGGLFTLDRFAESVPVLEWRDTWVSVLLPIQRRQLNN
jgi:hypothetical protein